MGSPWAAPYGAQRIRWETVEIHDILNILPKRGPGKGSGSGNKLSEFIKKYSLAGGGDAPYHAFIACLFCDFFRRKHFHKLAFIGTTKGARIQYILPKFPFITHAPAIAGTPVQKRGNMPLTRSLH